MCGLLGHLGETGTRWWRSVAYTRISARGVLKVRPHTKTSGPIYKKWGGGGGGNSLQVRYKKGVCGTKKILYR